MSDIEHANARNIGQADDIQHANDIQQAKQLLTQNTCVLVKGDIVLTDKAGGIRPMMNFIAKGIDLNGFCAADKVVGKAAAMLFVLAGVAEIYAGVLSLSGMAVLNKYNIKFTYNVLADVIKNRANTGVCPMEQAVEHIDLPSAAYQALREKLGA